MELPSYFIVSSALISVCGTFANSLSLSYFIKKDNESLGSRLLMLLNSLDLLVCVIATVTILSFYVITNININRDVLHSLYQITVESTGFATCVLSVTRTIYLCFPFYKINGKAIVVATASFIVYLVIREVIALTVSVTGELFWYLDVYTYLIITSFTLIIIVVVGSNIISAMKLLKNNEDELGARRITELNRKMTVTVLILSVLFCSLNLVYLVLQVVVHVLFYLTLRRDIPANFWTVFEFAYLIAIPLNSALNPIVYFTRKRGMRVYVNELWQKVTSC